MGGLQRTTSSLRSPPGWKTYLKLSPSIEPITSLYQSFNKTQVNVKLTSGQTSQVTHPPPKPGSSWSSLSGTHSHSVPSLLYTKGWSYINTSGKHYLHWKLRSPILSFSSPHPPPFFPPFQTATTQNPEHLAIQNSLTEQSNRISPKKLINTQHHFSQKNP